VTETPPGSGRGTLYVVATPIGNLGDITLRALDVLREVSVVAAEDTRVTRKLWSRFEIETPLVSYHAHSDDRRTAELVEQLESGDDVALVTDAGTPLVSDPGEVLVGAWAERGGRVVPIPGASAVLAALVASALPAARWGFEGFLPRKGRERKERLARIAADDRATVIYEAHGRAAATLRELALSCGADRRAVVARELTKLHEEVRRGGLMELAAQLEAAPVKGEVVIVVSGSTEEEVQQVSLQTGRARVERLVAEGLKRSAAARMVAEDTGLPRRELFTPDG
jgi:16S rRNA (cytidine1402-2'-O)-methyltransferase